MTLRELMKLIPEDFWDSPIKISGPIITDGNYELVSISIDQLGKEPVTVLLIMDKFQ